MYVVPVLGRKIWQHRNLYLSFFMLQNPFSVTLLFEPYSSDITNAYVAWFRIQVMTTSQLVSMSL
jgi:hypothetical protein